MDAFNLYGLRAITPNFTATLNTLLDRSTLSTPLPDTIRLYGLIHSRYILTTPGLSQMSEKYLNGDFGYCPLIKCGGEKNRQKCLPIGISDVPGVSSIKLYCPRCQNTFEKNTQSLESDTEIDGAHFGSSFLGSFFLGNPELVVEGECKEVPDVMRVFGFKVHGSSVALQSSVREEFKKRKANSINEDHESKNRKKIKREKI